jgi:hypothetical protein
MSFKILHASDLAEAELWDGLIEKLPRRLRDMHFTSAYGRVQEKQGGEAVLAVFTRRDKFSHDEFIVQPFIKRRTPYVKTASDWCSPYGYGGPVGTTDTIPYESTLEKWAVADNVVSEFCYMHPLIDQRKWITCIPTFVRDVVVIDLPTFDEVKCARRVRRGIAKARESKALVIPSDNRRLFAEFYAASMERKQAAQRWRWSDDYIDAHFEEKIDARLFHIAAGAGERMLMTVGAYGTAYAHLLASNGEATNIGIDEMLYVDAAKILRDDGYIRFHLGGGMSSAQDDPLLAFKSGFAEPTHKLFAYRRIFFPSIYEELCRRKRRDEIEQHGHIFNSGFFPLYRREAA